MATDLLVCRKSFRDRPGGLSQPSVRDFGMAKSFEYLVSGRGPTGGPVADFVNAENGGPAAVREYESQGNTNVLLHTDDVVALMKHYALSKFFSPMEQTALPTMGVLRRYFLFVRISYRQIWFLAVLAVAVLAMTWFMGGTTFYLVEVSAVVLLFFPFLMNLVLMWIGAARYVRLLRTIGHGQWGEALGLIAGNQTAAFADGIAGFEGAGGSRDSAGSTTRS